MSKVNSQSVIEKIVFDITLDGVTYKDVTLDYSNREEDIYKNIPDEFKDDDDEWSLTLAQIHYEDNDSWCTADLGDKVYDFQFYGIDDSLAYCKRGRCYDDEKAMRIPIRYQMNLMVLDDNGYYSHTDTWSYNSKMENVRVYTKDGLVKIEIYEE